jgi:hypothetical protein
MSFHDEEGHGSIHISINWTYANAAARTGATGLTALDVEKFARQLDDNSVWMLVDDSPVTWVQLTSGGAPAAHKASHENGGSDEISVAGLSGVLADAQTPAAHNQAASTISDFDTEVSNNTDVAANTSARHARSHAITGTSDHSSSATSGRMLKADANGLPVDATNTDSAVAAAVTASHARSHAVTDTSDHTSGNWKTFYSNGSGQVVELANGDANKVLTSGGASAAPSWATPAATASLVNIFFTPRSNMPPSSTYATLGNTYGRYELAFDDGTDEAAIFSGFLYGYNGGGLTVTLIWRSTATSGNVVWSAEIERNLVGTDVASSDSFAAAQTVTDAAQGVAQTFNAATITFTNGAQMDSLATRESFRIRIKRVGSSGSDTMSGDAFLYVVHIRET